MSAIMLYKEDCSSMHDFFSYIRIRFRANNPGVWLLHCHTESHLDRGMSLMLHVSSSGFH